MHSFLRDPIRRHKSRKVSLQFVPCRTSILFSEIKQQLWVSTTGHEKLF